MKPAGYLARASRWPLFDDLPHPVLVVRAISQTGLNGVLGISHSTDLFDLYGSLRLTKELVPSAFAAGALADGLSALGVSQGRLSLEVRCQIDGDVIVSLGDPPIQLTHGVELSAQEWELVRRGIAEAAKRAVPRR